MTKKTKKPEAISNETLVTATGGFGWRWAANHPYRAQAFFENHPRQAERFAEHHPWLAARWGL